VRSDTPMKVSALLARILKRHSTVASSPNLSIKEALAPISEPFRGAVLSMYSAKSMVVTDGQQHPIDPLTGIPPSQGMWFYELCCSLKPEATLEVGFAYGFSAVFFLAAGAANKVGHHTAIDPFQRSHWYGIGLANVRAEGAESSFRLIEERSDRAATDHGRQNSTFDVIFIDGNHRLDDALVDFYLYAPLCKIEGLIILDDMWMSSIQTVASFIRSNRPDFVDMATHHPRISAFRRVGEDRREWDHFQPFTVAGNGQVNR
jgi:predicted O-methyltransferase YrrM